MPHILRRSARDTTAVAVVQGWQGVVRAAIRLARMTGTFALVSIGWVFFRSESLTSAFTHLGRMITDLHLHTPTVGSLHYIL